MTITCVIVVNAGLLQLEVVEHAWNENGAAAVRPQVRSGTSE